MGGGGTGRFENKIAHGRIDSFLLLVTSCENRETTLGQRVSPIMVKFGEGNRAQKPLIG